MILTPDYHFYSRVAFNNEAEIERIVLDNFKKIFGDYALLLPKTKINTLGGTGTIPDGIVVDFEDEEWSIIEVELAGHGTWQHIAPQISKQLTATITDSAQAKIVDLCLTMIGSDSEFQDSLEELGIKLIDIHGKLNTILRKKPVVALPIDDIPADLDQWAQTLTYTVKLWKVEKYIDAEGNILYTMPDDAIPNLVSGVQPLGLTLSGTSSGSLLSSVLAAGLLAEGDRLWFKYGPKGQSKTPFEGIVRKDGIEVDGRAYSPSIAAIRCINRVNPSRTTANGWTTWKTPNGKLIIELLKQVPE